MCARKTFFFNFDTPSRINLYSSLTVITPAHSTGAKGDGIGKLMVPGDAGMITSFPADPPRSQLITADELAEYVKAYKKQGFRPSLGWYHNTKLNWEEEAGLPTDITVPALMVTGGRDVVLKAEMTEGARPRARCCALYQQH
jgi:alpha-beta hydrolase superfamily lysophospholipase